MFISLYKIVINSCWCYLKNKKITYYTIVEKAMKNDQIFILHIWINRGVSGSEMGFYLVFVAFLKSHYYKFVI